MSKVNTKAKNNTVKKSAKVQKTKQSKNHLLQLNIKELADEQLIKNFALGCINSYEEIISRYEAKVHHLALRLTKNAEDAEEVLQDVFITVYRKIEGFEGKAKFSSWLYRITVNAAFMKLRKRRQEQASSLEELSFYVQQQIVEDRSIYSAQTDSLAINNEIKEALESAISKLPEEYRAVFVLRDIDGLSNKAVSDILDLSIPAIKSRLHRSRLMLRKRLRKFYEDYAVVDAQSRKDVDLQEAA